MEIYIIDTETTGLDGYPKDFVVDIGVVCADTDKKTVKTVFSSVVGYDVTKWTYAQKHSWIFENSDLKLEDVQNAPPAEEVAKKFSEIISGKKITAYNMQYDFDKFLMHKPWNIGKCGSSYVRDIMLAAKDYCKIPSIYKDDYKWPKLEYAYQKLCEDDPAGISEGQDHRALSDAVAASYVLLRLIELGYYRTE